MSHVTINYKAPVTLSNFRNDYVAISILGVNTHMGALSLNGQFSVKKKTKPGGVTQI